MICKKSGCIQSYFLLPLDVLYANKYAEALERSGKIIINLFCDFISKNAFGNILEIGGSNGSLALQFCNKNKDVKWTIIEPNSSKKPFQHKNINFIDSYFSKDLKFEKGRTVVHSHVFEHIYNPLEFLKDISEYLEENELQILSIPNLPRYLESRFSNTINFEHTFISPKKLWITCSPHPNLKL